MCIRDSFEGSEGIKLEERLAIIRMLDSMGITYIDIGTPENSEEYDRFLKQALELQLESAVLTPFIRAKDCLLYTSTPSMKKR